MVQEKFVVGGGVRLSVMWSLFVTFQSVAQKKFGWNVAGVGPMFMADVQGGPIM